MNAPSRCTSLRGRERRRHSRRPAGSRSLVRESPRLHAAGTEWAGRARRGFSSRPIITPTTKDGIMFKIDEVAGAFHQKTRTKDTGAVLEHYFWSEGERYLFDFRVCTSERGWVQYDTSQDAWYYGVWVHVADREIVNYCEGDLYVTRCPDEASFQAELRDLHAFHGAPPPCATGIDTDGSVTKFYDTEAALAVGRPLPETLSATPFKDQ